MSKTKTAEQIATEAEARQKEPLQNEGSKLATISFTAPIELLPKYYSAEKRERPIVFLPLKRSDNVQDRFKNSSPTFLWACELLEDYPLSRDKKPVDGIAGDMFLMFEPSMPGVQSILANAHRAGLAVQLFCDGKVKRFIQSQNRTCEVWEWRCALSTRPIKPSISQAQLLLPAPTGGDVTDAPDEIPF